MAFGEGLQNVWEKIKREVPKLPGKAVSAARNNLMNGRDLANKIVEMAAEQVVMAPFTGGITNPATMLTGYVPEAQAMIRPGGNPALNMFKNLPSLVGPDQVRRSIVERGWHANPSVGISDRNIFAFDRSPTLIYNPTSHLFDPHYAKANQVYNRDSFSFVGYRPDVSKPHRLYGHDVRGTEQGQESNPLLDASPRFKSFRHYEKDKAGAATLDTKTGKHHNDYYDEANKLLASIGEYGGVHSRSVLSRLKDKAKSVPDTYEGKQAAAILDLLRTAESSYGELKVMGSVPINPSTVSAFILPEKYLSPVGRDRIKRMMEPTGIRTGTAAELLPQEHKSRYVDLAEQMVEVAKTKNKSYDEAPEFMKPYVPKHLFGDLQLSDTPITTATRLIKSSPKFATDVASILTAQDSDDLLNLLWKDK